MLSPLQKRFRFVANVLALVLGLGALGAAHAQQQAAQPLFFQGFELVKDSKWQEAADKFEEGLKIEPNNALAHYFLAESYRGLKNEAKAREHYKQSLELDANSQVAAEAKKRLAELSGNVFAEGSSAPTRAEAENSPAPGAMFKDCDDCPQMVVIPAGQFVMGSPPSEAGRDGDEGPPHKVTISRPFAVGKYEVTFAEWGACVAANACGAVKDEGWGRGTRPVINVSYEQAVGYAEWLEEKTGKKYRLLTEAEWEYAARAGSDKARHWGSSTDRACQFANVYDLAGKGKRKLDWENFNCDDGYAETAPVGAFKPNAFGLYDMLGNVWEWVQDCYNDSYSGAPTDGSAWATGDCSLRVRSRWQLVLQTGDPSLRYSRRGLAIESGHTTWGSASPGRCREAAA